MSAGAPPPPPHPLSARSTGSGGGGGAARPPSSAGLADPWLHPPRPASPPRTRFTPGERRAAVRGGLAGAAACLGLVALAWSALGGGGGAAPAPPARGRTALRGTAPILDPSHPGAEGGALWGAGAEGRGTARAPVLPSTTPSAPTSTTPRPPVLISYAYSQKDAVQAANAAFFIAVGAQVDGVSGVVGGGGGREAAGAGRRADVVFTVSGPACGPCGATAAGLAPLPIPPPLASTLTSAWGRDGFTLLHRTGNVGMDFGAHNASLAWAAAAAAATSDGWGAGRPARPASATPALAAARRFGYAFFIFLNSSARGPFFPSYLPAGWHWTRAFTDGLDRGGCGPGGGGEGGAAPAAPACLPPGEAPPPGAAAALVASSLVCLPPEDAGGPGPRAESWAFALSSAGLAAAEGAGAFRVRSCKLCAGPDAGIVVGGEYGLSSAVLGAGLRLATLQARYARGLDWADRSHWACNGCAHASRHGTYGPGLSLHPFETMFVKASWGVGAPFLEAYTAWATGHVRGDDPGTGGAAGGSGPGACDGGLYRYAVSPSATDPAATAHVARCFLPPGLVPANRTL